MTATVHKILVRSKQLLESTVLPAGYFGEKAAEARNKTYMSEDFIMQGSTTDFVDSQMCFNSSLHLNRCIQKHKRFSLPHEVIALLSCDFKPAKEFVDGADYYEEDDYDFFYNIEIENEEHKFRRHGGGVSTTRKKIIKMPCVVQELLIYAKKTGQSPHSALFACTHSATRQPQMYTYICVCNICICTYVIDYDCYSQPS